MGIINMLAKISQSSTTSSSCRKARTERNMISTSQNTTKATYWRKEQQPPPSRSQSWNAPPQDKTTWSPELLPTHLRPAVKGVIAYHALSQRATVPATASCATVIATLHFVFFSLFSFCIFFRIWAWITMNRTINLACLGSVPLAFILSYLLLL